MNCCFNCCFWTCDFFFLLIPKLWTSELMSEAVLGYLIDPSLCPWWLHRQLTDLNPRASSYTIYIPRMITSFYVSAFFQSWQDVLKYWFTESKVKRLHLLFCDVQLKDATCWLSSAPDILDKVKTRPSALKKRAWKKKQKLLWGEKMPSYEIYRSQEGRGDGRYMF